MRSVSINTFSYFPENLSVSTFVTEDILWGAEQQRAVCVLRRTSRLRGGGREGAGTETPQVCLQRAAVSECQLQCCISCSLLALPGALGVRGTRTAVHNGLSEKRSNACHSKWGFDSFVLFFAPVWRAAPTRGSLPRHFGSKVLVTLIFISLGPFELHCPSSKV